MHESMQGIVYSIGLYTTALSTVLNFLCKCSYSILLYHDNRVATGFLKNCVMTYTEELNNSCYMYSTCIEKRKRAAQSFVLAALSCKTDTRKER